MALLRLLSFPSTYHFPYSTQQLFSQTASLSISPLSHTLAINSQRPTLLQFHVSASTQAQATIETPESDTVEEEEDDDGTSGTRLLAQNVPWTCTADDIRPLFEKYGTVLDVEFSMYNKTRNRGLAFVTMGSHEEAQAAISNLESYEFEGRALKLTWARPKKPPPSPAPPKPVPIHNLFVANLPFQARAKDLKEFFNADNANVVSAEVIFYDNPRRSAGYGFVSFNTKMEAEAALSDFQGKMFMGRPIRVARSRKFLRQETKVNIQSENTSSVLNPDAGQSEKADEV